jgi:hypothetical protein
MTDIEIKENRRKLIEETASIYNSKNRSIDKITGESSSFLVFNLKLGTSFTQRFLVSSNSLTLRIRLRALFGLILCPSGLNEVNLANSRSILMIWIIS